MGHPVTQSSDQGNRTEPSGGESKAPVDQLVLHYLQAKGYSKTASSLQNEAAVQSLTELSEKFSPNEDVSLPNYILFYNQAEEGTPEAYRNSYGQLREWIERSLDLYQPEFMTALYPIFVHAYLTLVNKQLKDQAHAFWELYHDDHRWRHPTDIERLSKIQEPTHVTESPLAQLFQSDKYNIRLSKVAFELLMSFLQEHKMMLLLRIVNQHLSIKVEDQPQGTQGDVGLVGHSNAQIDHTNQVPLTLGRRPMDSELRNEIEQTLKEVQHHKTDMDIDVPAGDLLQELAKIKKEPVSDAPGVLDIPYPPIRGIDIKTQLQELADSRKRVALGRESLPSVCCFTFHNTYDGLNCTDISDNLELMAGGFSESYIKVWSLTGEPLRGLRSNFNPAHVSDMNDLNRFRERTDHTYKKLIGHAGPVFGVSMSHDSRYLVSCSEDKTARLWSLDTFTNLVCYRGHNYPIWDISFGPYSFYFATASHDKTARLWSCEHIYPLRIFAGHLADVDCVRFHPNSKYLVTGSTDQTCRLWDVQRGTSVRVFTGHTAPITAVAISPNGRTMASASEDKVIHLWDLGSGKKIQQLVGHEKVVYSLAFSQESTLLMSGGADCTVRLWDVHTDTTRQLSPMAHENSLIGSTDILTQPSIVPSHPTKSTSDNLSTVQPSETLLATFPTKRTPVYQVYYTKRNLGIAVGAFQPAR
ncbi:Transcription initiation factor TFIID subunit 5 [Dispira simplex]|nr:Transcription initiation factor TFIID subunit 5 [Dispira simplex]